MENLVSINGLKAAAAEAARADKLEPLVYTPRVDILKAPFIGDYLPDGWQRVDLRRWYPRHEHGVYGADNEGFGAFFVDGSGLGEKGEDALTFEEFLPHLRSGYGYALVEVGQFQVKVGVFRPASPDYEVKCCLCGIDILNVYDSNNPAPLGERDDDRCCRQCNWHQVIPTRLAQHESSRSTKQ